LLLALLFAGCAAAPTPTTTPEPERTPLSWTDSLLATLTLEQKVGQMLMGRMEGDFENVGSSQMERVVRWITQYGVGGFAVGIGTPADFALKLNYLQSQSDLPLWFAADLEWGSGMRLWRPSWLPYGTQGDGGTAFPFNMGVAATGDPAFAEAAGRITGREARAVGVHWVFAPVADVNTAADNPIVNVRSYGSDPRQVARYVTAFVRGAQSAGVLTTAKHFPGHGDTSIDSHVSLPVLEVTRERLDTLELIPFRAARDAGVAAIMTGHLAVPALTGNRAMPVSIAAQTSAVLRHQLDFRGLVITDAMTMGALRDLPGYSPGDLAVRAVEAGTDVVLSAPDIVQAHRAIVAAVESGRLTRERIDESVKRILLAKESLGLVRHRLVDVNAVHRIVAAPEHEALAAEIAQRSITLARDAAGHLPLDPRRMQTLAVIAFSAPNDVGAGRTLATELGRLYSTLLFTRLDESVEGRLFDEAVQQAARADAVILATFLMPISGQGHIRVPPRAEQLAQRLVELGKPMVTLAFGDPYGPARLATAGTFLLAWQPRNDHAQVAAARALAGLAPITGTLPVALPAGPNIKAATEAPTRPRADYTLSGARAESAGMSESALQRVDSIIEAAVADRAAPGAAIAIGRHGKLVRLRGFGRLDYRPQFEGVTDSSIYDLASLTKVVGTTSAAMLLVQDGLLQLDVPVEHYLPEWTGSIEKRQVTVRHLLTHSAGLPPFLPLWQGTRGKEAYLARLAAVPLDYVAGARMVYSDLGLMLVGFIVERLTGQPLDEFLHARLFDPLRLQETLFNPLAQSIALASTGTAAAPSRHPERIEEPASDLLLRIAPTEIDTLFRRQHMHGRVHDENAFAAGGVVGHAGLFSSVRDLAAFAQMLLNGGFYGGSRVFSKRTVDTLRTRQNSFSSRAIGWDMPAACGLGTAAGDYFSAASIGHTGFTGTSLWIDFERDLFVVLLTNRVNPTRDNQKHVPLRRAVHDAVQQAIVDMPVEPREWIRNPRLARECR
jgi:beta-glucosidase-like glycosyl hydrolase/CubicO group peptidase (beta-lactamase class C family)